MTSGLQSVRALVFDAYGTLFDTQSVIGELERAYPGRGEYLTQVWRLKQLEYSWLRGLSRQYADFRQVTCDALRYSLGTLGLAADAAIVEPLADAYDRLSLFADSLPALQRLNGRRLAVFSNGSPGMLSRLVDQAGIGGAFERLISVDAVRSFKPDPATYGLACETLGLPPSQVMLVSSNGFDIAGGAAFGLRTARVERLGPGELTRRLTTPAALAPTDLFRALRSQLEGFGGAPDVTVDSLTGLADALSG